MKARDLIVKMNSVSTGIIAHALNLPLQALDAMRLIRHTLSDSPHSLS